MTNIHLSNTTNLLQFSLMEKKIVKLSLEANVSSLTFAMNIVCLILKLAQVHFLIVVIEN